MKNEISISNRVNVINPEQVMPLLKTALNTKQEIRFAYIFGSLVSGTANVLSDIDVAIFIDPAYKHPPGGYGYQSELIGELSSLCSHTVDVVILNRAPTLLKHRVISRGLLIFSRNEAERRDFHEITNRNYLDLEPLFKVQREYLNKRLQKLTAGVKLVVDSEMIYRKLAELLRYREQLKKHQGLTVDKLENDLDQLWIIEHGLQLCIQVVLDIGNHIIAAEGLSVNEYADIIPALAKLEVIPEDYTLSVKGMPGLRNLLVHEYSELDEAILIDVINNRLDDFVLFSSFITRYLKNQ